MLFVGFARGVTLAAVVALSASPLAAIVVGAILLTLIDAFDEAID